MKERKRKIERRTELKTQQKHLRHSVQGHKIQYSSLVLCKGTEKILRIAEKTENSGKEADTM